MADDEPAVVAAAGMLHLFPASGIRHPASGIRHPASGIRLRNLCLFVS
jgi:hypothetical protein